VAHLKPSGWQMKKRVNGSVLMQCAASCPSCTRTMTPACPESGSTSYRRRDDEQYFCGASVSQKCHRSRRLSKVGKYSVPMKRRARTTRGICAQKWHRSRRCVTEVSQKSEVSGPSCTRTRAPASPGSGSTSYHSSDDVGNGLSSAWPQKCLRSRRSQ